MRVSGEGSKRALEVEPIQKVTGVKEGFTMVRYF